MIQYFSPLSSPHPIAVTAWFVFSHLDVFVISKSDLRYKKIQKMFQKRKKGRRTGEQNVSKNVKIE